ncbi:MAG: class I SAM-dependent methyltransferase [Xanthobacteraceae bacterium]|nr:class I SAM-dependent methyltransferase [Xanthobacteraceae bacterium]
MAAVVTAGRVCSRGRSAIGLLRGALGRVPATLLELGSGGGNNALHLKRHATMTLVDLAPDMLAMSRKLNPDLEHIAGDMRTVRLGRTFDAVFIHDAIMYMLTEDDLAAALTTAYVHLKVGGAVLVMPDCVSETYVPSVEDGGEDGEDGRAMRYLIWTHPPVAGTTAFCEDFAMLLRKPDGTVECVHDRHLFGVFSRAQWQAAFRRAGFAGATEHADPWRQVVCLARKD